MHRKLSVKVFYRNLTSYAVIDTLRRSMYIDTMERKEKTTVFVKGFPKGLWERFRALCLIERKTVLQKLIELIEDSTKHLDSGSN